MLTALLTSARFHGTGVLLAACVIAPAAAAKRPPVTAAAPGPWATVNSCDTAEHPDTVGVRGSMPGSGVPAERMFMRFALEYLSVPDGAWRAVGAAGDSGWIPVGSGKYRRREAGRNFTVRPPASGMVRLRAVARFEWRRGGRVTARALRRTTAGHAPTAGADPAGYSAATCDVAA